MPKEYLKFTIRDQISDWIRDNKSSQAKLAKEIGISEATLNRFMSGKTDTLGIEQIVKLAEIFGCSTDYLLGVTDIPRHQIIDAEELGLTEKAAKNILYNQQVSVALNSLLENSHFIKTLHYLAVYISDDFSDAVTEQRNFTKGVIGLINGIDCKAWEAKAAAEMVRPNLGADLTSAIESEFMTAVREVKKDFPTVVHEKSLTKDVFAMFSESIPADKMRGITPEQIGVMVANVVKSMAGNDEGAQKIFESVGTELMKSSENEDEKNDNN